METQKIVAIAGIVIAVAGVMVALFTSLDGDELPDDVVRTSGDQSPVVSGNTGDVTINNN